MAGHGLQNLDVTPANEGGECFSRPPEWRLRGEMRLSREKKVTLPTSWSLWSDSLASSGTLGNSTVSTMRMFLRIPFSLISLHIYLFYACVIWVKVFISK